MKKTKIILPVILILVIVLGFIIPLFSFASIQPADNKAAKAALTAAKTKFSIEGVSKDAVDNAVITSVKCDKKNSVLSITVRADRVHKYVCDIKTNKFLGQEVKVPDSSSYANESGFSAFFSQMFEKIGYFYSHLFKSDRL